MAWIQKRPRKDGSFSYKLYWRDPSKRIRTETFRTRKEADRRRRSLEHQMDVGSYLDPTLGKIPLAEFWEYFIRTAGPAAESTQSLYRMQAKKYILPRLGTTPLNKISKPGVRTFLADLQDAGKGPATVKSTYRLLRRVLSVAVEEGRIPANPAARIETPKSTAREMNFLTPKELVALSNAVDDRYRVLILFLGFTGVRIGEAAGLRVKNLDLLQRQARIVEASKEVDGRQFVGSTKNRLNRTITLPKFLAEELSLHLVAYGDSKMSQPLVFSTSGGGFVRQKNFRSRVFKPAVKKTGLAAGLRPHDLRHTAVAMAIQAGWHPRKIQEMLGHSSIEVTLGTYGHLFDSLHSDGADRMDALYRESVEQMVDDVVPLSVRSPSAVMAR
jgi:integrase